MEDSGTKDRSDIEPPNPHQNGLGIWTVIVVLSAFLIAAGVVSYLIWTTSGTSMPTAGYLAMTLGVIFSLVVGVGLMVLIFYSSRKGYDEPVVFIQEPADDRDEAQTRSSPTPRSNKPGDDIL
jgi:asparagine N-glycosylation enzyme membrane subunit Stt3